MKSNQKKFLLLAFVATAVQLIALTAWAVPIRTCVLVQSRTSLKTEQLRDMVQTELAHFPSHQMVADKCETTLHVETFPFAEKKYLTLRMEGEVPVRYAYASSDTLVHNIKKGLPLVLGNDPVYLKENISQYSDAQRALYSVSIKGTTRLRMELFESITRTGKGAVYGPGIAAGLFKGSHNAFIFTRIHASMGLPQDTDAAIKRPVAAGLDAGFRYEFNKTKPVAGYIGGGLGVAFLRFEGDVDNRQLTANELLLQCFGRIGIRLFRLTDFDMDLFVTGYLPFHPASDVDTTLFGSSGRTYTPQTQIGIGIGF